MSDTKSLASLSPTLLARKGGAKPAMRPQLQPLHEFQESAARDMAEDLGWNDMGADLDDMPQHEASAEILSIAGDANARLQVAEVPQVIHQQAGLSKQISTGTGARKAALAEGRRAAFTLRLDADRHLKLRLASTVLGRSGQDIVTEALDRHLGALADIDELAAKIRQSR